MKQTWIIFFCFFIQISNGNGIWNGGTAWMDWTSKQCEAAIKQVLDEDRATIVDDNPNRLHATWLSQECEVRAGPEYVIRKYTFYQNGTFLLIRHHYAEESCSIATHTVIAKGIIRLLSSSRLAPGATETKYQLDQVHIIPLTHQVAHKFEHRVNNSCTSQSHWRAFETQTIYESQRYLNFNFEIPSYYQFKRSQRSGHHQGSISDSDSSRLNCLEPLGIDFNELKLIRVEKKTATSTAFGLGSNGHPRVELLLGSLPPNNYAKKSHRSSSLQPTALIRSDTTRGCLICGAISRATKNNPPLLHQVAALPALLGGSWISSSCESYEGSLWTKRQLQFYSGDFLWTGRWDYYSDPKCNQFLYTVTAAGSYVQRAERQKRYQTSPSEENSDEEKNNIYSSKQVRSSKNLNNNNKFLNNNSIRSKRDTKVHDNYYSKYDKWHLDWITADSAKLLDIFGSRHARIPLPSNLFKNIDNLPSNTDLNIKNKLQASTVSSTTTVTSTTISESEIETTTSTVTSTIDNIYNEIEKKNFKVNYVATATDDSYRHLLKNSQPSMAESFLSLLRGNQNGEPSDATAETVLMKKKSLLLSKVPTGTSELDLHVAESLLIPGDLTIANNCGASIDNNGYGGYIIRPLNYWPKNCVKHPLEASSSVELRARIGVNWSGQYTLLLRPRDNNLWEAPLRRCGSTPAYNYVLSLGYKYGLFISSSSYSYSSSSTITFHDKYYCTLVFFIFTVYSLRDFL